MLSILELNQTKFVTNYLDCVSQDVKDVWPDVDGVPFFFFCSRLQRPLATCSRGKREMRGCKILYFVNDSMKRETLMITFSKEVRLR